MATDKKEKTLTMKDLTETLLSGDVVITTTTLKAGVVAEKGLTIEGVTEALSADVVALPVDKKALSKGRHVAANEDGSLTIFTVDQVEVKNAFLSSSASSITKCWYDGYKRSRINAGNHRAIAVALGLVSGKQAAKREAARLEGVKIMVLGMLKTGLVPRETIRGITSVDDATWQMWLAEAEEGP